MIINHLFSTYALIVTVAAQTYTLSGCHRHGNVEYCYLPDGTETPWSTYAESSVPSATATSTLVSSTVAAAAEVAPTAVTGCHMHDIVQFCMVGSTEWEVTSQVDAVTAPDSYEGCHAHGETELHCTSGDTEITLVAMGATAEGEDHGHRAAEGLAESATAEGISCHDHAGVPHCVDADGNTVENTCSRPEKEYNVPFRVGLLFVILVTSALGVFAPILTLRFTSLNQDHIVIVAMRQFGTGIIISTAIVHLFTHAELYFGSECLGGLNYEATTGAILMAGLFLTFIIEYIAHRVSAQKSSPIPEQSSRPADNKDTEAASEDPQEIEKSAAQNLTLKTTIMEAGIIFHSVLIGLVLVVAGDSGFITLFIVILFHQIFEGFALGSRISIIPGGLLHKMLLGAAFAVTTPIGMAIGIGVLSQFNGNDPSTLIAIGTLNAFSAGILLWVGVVELWFMEWFYGPLAHAGVLKTAICMTSLVSGIVVMSVLGKWA